MNINLARIQQYMDWLKHMLFLDWRSKNTQACTRKVQRGQVYYCDFGRGIGNEQEKSRPCIILQNNVGNIYSPNTIVAPISSKAGVPKVTVKLVNEYTYIESDTNTVKVR